MEKKLYEHFSRKIRWAKYLNIKNDGLVISWIKYKNFNIIKFFLIHCGSNTK